MDLQTACPIKQNPNNKMTIKNKFIAIATVLSAYLFFFTIFFEFVINEKKEK
jgi:hypothetical protein